MSASVPVYTLNRAYSAIKFLDQKHLLNAMGKTVMPTIPLVGAGIVGYQTMHASPSDRSTTLLRQSATLATTVLATLWATRRYILKPQDMKDALKAVSESAAEMLATIPPEQGDLRQFIHKASRTVLRPAEIHKLRLAFLNYAQHDKQAANALFEKIIPTPEGNTGKQMLGDIKDLSMMGLFPVVGGVAGGMLGDALVGKTSRKRVKNQVEEGAFQYLANIVLCNIGAACMLGILEMSSKKLAVKRLPRMVAMTLGIVSFGIVGGSAIANFIGKNFITPVIQKGPLKAAQDLHHDIKRRGLKTMTDNLYQERKPEFLDAILHIDDFMVAGQLAGLEWLGRALPFLYGISALRSSAGYRNGESPAAITPRSPMATEADPFSNRAEKMSAETTMAAPDPSPGLAPPPYPPRFPVLSSI